MSLKYEPSSDPLHISVKAEACRERGRSDTVGCQRTGILFTLVTGPGRSLSLKLSDTRVYEPQIRARLTPWDASAQTPSTLNTNTATLHTTTYTPHPTPYALHPTPYTLHPTPYTLHSTP